MTEQERQIKAWKLKAYNMHMKKRIKKEILSLSDTCENMLEVLTGEVLKGYKKTNKRHNDLKNMKKYALLKR